MPNAHFYPYISFDGHRRILAGSLPEVALAIKRATEKGSIGPILIFDNATGCSIDFDLRGSEEEVATWLKGVGKTGEGSPPLSSEVINPEFHANEQRGRGRPKLGVIPREVTLLPRHWEWLATQPGGASVALRKLVEEARRDSGDGDRIRKEQERAYHFMSAIAGDMPGYEEATRALFAQDRSRFSELISTWPTDVRDHAAWLASSGSASR